MKFFKAIKNFYIENMKLVNKFILNQIALSIFGFMVCIAISSFGEWEGIITSVFASLFFCALLYDAAWDEGARDRNRVSNGRLPFRPFHGAKVALFAYIPSLIFILPGVVSTILRLNGVHFLETVEVICKAITMVLGFGTYLGIAYAFTSADLEISMLIFAACIIPAVVAYYLGYRLGLADKQLKTLVGMKPSLGYGAQKQKKK